MQSATRNIFEFSLSSRSEITTVHLPLSAMEIKILREFANVVNASEAIHGPGVTMEIKPLGMPTNRGK